MKVPLYKDTGTPSVLTARFSEFVALDSSVLYAPYQGVGVRSSSSATSIGSVYFGVAGLLYQM